MMRLHQTLVAFILCICASTSWGASQTVVGSFVAPLSRSLGGTGATSGGSLLSVTKIANYALQVTDGSSIINNNGASGPITLTLPAVAGNNGLTYCFSGYRRRRRSPFANCRIRPNNCWHNYWYCRWQYE